jgi:tetratricopeptide (TPR) repeat protein
MTDTDRPEPPQTTIRGQQQMLDADQALDIAARYHEAGDLTSAQVVCNRILEKWPGHPVALNLLGVIAYQLGKHEIAAGMLAEAIGVKPDYADAHFNLGNVLKTRGQLAEAVTRYMKAIECNPRHHDAHYNLGNALKSLGKLDDALAHYRRAVDLKPDYADAHNNSGNILKAQGKFKEALSAYERATRCKPDYVAAHFNLGTTLQELDRPSEAIRHYQRAIALRPDLAAAHSNLGTALRVVGRLEAAITHYCEAVKLEPGFLTAHNNLAALYERTNQLTLAERSIEQALAINPENADSQYLSAVLLRRRGDAAGALRLLEALDVDTLSENYRIRRYFEIGKLLDARGDHDDAFSAYSSGNLMLSSSANAEVFDKNRYRSKIESLRTVLGAGWTNTPSPPEGQRNDRAPIFIVGIPRSGTTLLDQILDSHPGVQVMEEIPVFAEVERELGAMPDGYPQALQGLTETDIARLREIYFDGVDRQFGRDTALNFVDKRPMNIEYVPLIQRMFPEASIVFACRHPCDVVLSNFMQYYNLNDAMANFCTVEDTVNLYCKLMDLWLGCVKLLPLSIHSVRYEELVSDFDTVVPGLYRFLGIDWAGDVEAFYQHAEKKNIINTPSYEQVIEPLYTRASGRWLKYRKQLEPHLGKLRPYIEQLGYPQPQ